MKTETETKIIQIVKLKTSLEEDEALKIAKDRASQFKTIRGLVQKYYVRASPPHHFAGIYVWDSMESLKSFRESELAASIPQAYKLLEPPEIEVLEVMFKLR